MRLGDMGLWDVRHSRDMDWGGGQSKFGDWGSQVHGEGELCYGDRGCHEDLSYDGVLLVGVSKGYCNQGTI